jgi:uncharacterized damage-inducible protein DinB
LALGDVYRHQGTTTAPSHRTYVFEGGTIVKKMTIVSAVAIALFVGATMEAQQTAPAQAGSGTMTANPLSAGAKKTYSIIKNYVTKAAAKMPEENYSFKPTPEVRSFGQLVGHLADANFGFCAAAAGEKPPMGGFDGSNSIEKTKTAKADLEKALAASYEYCDKVHASMTDSGAAQMVKLFGNELPKLSVLEFNTHHNFEHYGNMVTYMRIKNLVPPSSEQQPPPSPSSK